MELGKRSCPNTIGLVFNFLLFVSTTPVVKEPVQLSIVYIGRPWHDQQPILSPRRHSSKGRIAQCLYSSRQDNHLPQFYSNLWYSSSRLSSQGVILRLAVMSNTGILISRQLYSQHSSLSIVRSTTLLQHHPLQHFKWRNATCSKFPLAS